MRICGTTVPCLRRVICAGWIWTNQSYDAADSSLLRSTAVVRSRLGATPARLHPRNLGRNRQAREVFERGCLQGWDQTTSMSPNQRHMGH
jgi:hypothetical protein